MPTDAARSAVIDNYGYDIDTVSMNCLEALRLESTEKAHLAAEVFEGAEALNEELCEEFNRRVAEAHVMAEAAFRTSCALAKRTGDVDETAQIWREMTGLCDDVELGCS